MQTPGEQFFTSSLKEITVSAVDDKNETVLAWVKLTPIPQSWVLKSFVLFSTPNAAFIAALQESSRVSEQIKAVLHNIPDQVIDAIVNCVWSNTNVENFNIVFFDMITDPEIMTRITTAMEESKKPFVQDLKEKYNHDHQKKE